VAEAVCKHQLGRKPSRTAGRSGSERPLVPRQSSAGNQRAFSLQIQIADGGSTPRPLCRRSVETGLPGGSEKGYHHHLNSSGPLLNKLTKLTDAAVSKMQ
jgi:hypothetical protein